jgi:hypothetical protein
VACNHVLELIMMMPLLAQTGVTCGPAYILSKMFEGEALAAYLEGANHFVSEPLFYGIFPDPRPLS